LFLSSNTSRASIDYNTDGATYTQNFDSLPNTPENTSLGATPIGWIDDTTSPGANQFSIQGWYLFHASALGPTGEGGANQHQRMRIGAGTVNTGAFMSFGTSGSTERALGMVNSNTLTATVGGNAYFGMRLTNNTGNTIYGFTISYDGEQWRDGGNATPASETDTMQYAFGASGIQDSPSYSNLPASLNFTSPVNANTGSGAAVVGNTAGKVSVGPVTVSDIAWQPGTDLWLRWLDVNATGNDHGMAIDNVNFTASQFLPEPACASLVAIGALFGLRRTRRAAR
jgi:hypothetical protein